MQPDTTSIDLPALDVCIDRHPLTAAPEIPLIDVIRLMGQGQQGSRLFSPNLIFPRNNQNSHYEVGTQLSNVSLYRRASTTCVLVVKGISFVGIVTAQDILRLVIAGANLEQTKIGDVVTQSTITLTLSDTSNLFTALSLLSQHPIDCLPILAANGDVVGIITPDTLGRRLPLLNFLKSRRVSTAIATPFLQAPLSISILELMQRMVAEGMPYGVITVVMEREREGEGERGRGRDLGNLAIDIIPELHSAALTPPHLPASSPIPVGIITEEDLVRLVQLSLLGLDLSKTPAQLVMRSPLFGLSPDDSLWTAFEQMRQVCQMQPLVVYEESQNFLGVLTQRDLLSVFDPRGMLSIIEGLHNTVEQQGTELKEIKAQLQHQISGYAQVEAAMRESQMRLRLINRISTNAGLDVATNLAADLAADLVADVTD
ncbi:MAG TPA: hypothetical protein DEG47_07990, partial [Cyanobacteria bacterium UBA11148]|nr:hypothetical protein [Cyanobacteria bacterium UBA11148]